MGSDYARSVDWEEEYEDWENLGREALEDACTHETQDDGERRETNMRYSGYCEECDVCEDSAIPMMMFAYPLYCDYDVRDDEDSAKILRVVRETNCTVMYNSKEDTYYLALCGGGMDLSQDIALAYTIMERWIPFSLLMNVSTQPELSVGGDKWLKLATEMAEQLSHYEKQAESKRKEVLKGISQYKEDVKKRKK